MPGRFLQCHHSVLVARNFPSNVFKPTLSKSTNSMRPASAGNMKIECVRWRNVHFFHWSWQHWEDPGPSTVDLPQRGAARADFHIFSQGGWRVSQGGWKFFAANTAHSAPLRGTSLASSKRRLLDILEIHFFRYIFCKGIRQP